MSLHGRPAASGRSGRVATPSVARVCAPGAWAGVRALSCRRPRPASTSPSWCVLLRPRAALHARPPSPRCRPAARPAPCEPRAAPLQEIFGVFAGGGRLVIVAPGGEKDTQHLARLCKRHGVTSVVLVPSLLEALLRVRPAHLRVLRGAAAGRSRLTRLPRRAGARVRGVRCNAHHRVRRRGAAPPAREAVWEAAAAGAPVQRLRADRGHRGIDG